MKTWVLKLIIKLLAVAVVVLAVIVGKQSRQLSQMKKQTSSFEQEQETLSQQIQQSSHEHDEATRRLAIVQEENERLRRETSDAPRLRNDSQELARLKEADAQVRNDPTRAELNAWLARVSQLKQRLEKAPDARIPELQLVTESDWLNVARAKLETDDDYRVALSLLRTAGETKFYKMAVPALYEYMKANNGQFPTDLSQLRPYFGSPVDDAILQRWEVVPSDTLPAWKSLGDWVITQKAPIDPENDRRFGFSLSGSYVSDWPRKPE
jgi:biopolymer transport protein ExbB/TolQ